MRLRCEWRDGNAVLLAGNGVVVMNPRCLIGTGYLLTSSGARVSHWAELTLASDDSIINQITQMLFSNKESIHPMMH